MKQINHNFFKCLNNANITIPIEEEILIQITGGLHISVQNIIFELHKFWKQLFVLLKGLSKITHKHEELHGAGRIQCSELQLSYPNFTDTYITEQTFRKDYL